MQARHAICQSTSCAARRRRRFTARFPRRRRDERQLLRCVHTSALAAYSVRRPPEARLIVVLSRLGSAPRCSASRCAMPVGTIMPSGPASHRPRRRRTQTSFGRCRTGHPTFVGLREDLGLSRRAVPLRRLPLLLALIRVEKALILPVSGVMNLSKY